MYDFRETTPFTGADDNQLPAEAMLIDGQYIENLVPGYRTLQVGGRELLKQSATSNVIGISDGETLEYVRNPSREITVGYQLIADDDDAFRTAFYKLSGILHGDTHQVSFNDDLSVYWNAVLTDVDDVPKGRNAITSSFTLFVPDGIAHSVATKTFDNKDPKWNGSPLNLLTGTSNQETSGTVDLNNWNAPSQHPNISVTPGQKFAYQIFITNDNTVDLTAGIDVFSGTAWKATYLGNVIKAGTSGYSSVTFTIPSGADNIVTNAAKLVTRVPNAKTTVYWQEEKLSAGTTVSPWSPNPADPEYYTNTITVHNGGTYPVEPVITATMHADNGMVGIVNDHPGILQFGTQEIDGYTTDVSEKGLNGNFSAPISGTIYNQSATNNPNWGGDSSKPNKQTGSINYASDSYNGPHMEPAYASTGTYWNGPAAKIPIAATSQNTRNNNFTLTMMLHFETTVSELGRMELTLEAGGKVQYQMVVTDNNAVKDEIQVDCYVKDQQVGTVSLDRSKFTNDKLMQARLSKFGSSINFEVSPWNGKSGREMTVSLPPLTRPDMISENVEAFSVWFERNNTWGQAAMKLIAVQFDWQHVNWWTDIKNRFSNGDVLTIDVANAKTYLNGSENRTLHTIGNQWEQFKLPPGDTEIDITPSSWAQPFACEVEIREAWL
ncbi:distal tail protein Dit [Lacticaseibacillus paracasei]|uniref:distal tail protein Dit n=1 Tax=Lacticaseibacillus paracasei TaxID=1597 RepID=UPI001F61D5BE|nr:distal tail protein Dit [Lacticaseibacillus paracasei]